jgi:hypothetical protein
MVGLEVVDDLFHLVFGLVKGIQDPLAFSSFASLGIFSRYLHADFYPWHKSVLVSNPPRFERASELVRKVFTSSRCYPHGYLLNAEST